MSNNLERIFRQKVVKWLEDLPNTVVLPVHQLTIHGTPDLLCCIAGKFVALELKASIKANRRKKQVHILEKINTKGLGSGFFVYPENWDEIKEKLMNLVEKQKEKK